MGSNITLPAGYTGGAPRIVVYAARDAATRADVANLAEVDLVAAWVEPTTGAVQEHVERRIAPAGGFATTCQSFPLSPAGGPAAFQAGTPSFYYARVLQVPTNRWSVYDCQQAGANNPDCAAATPTTPPGKLDVQIAERAWTSPVWYLP